MAGGSHVALRGLDNFTKCILALAETKQSGAMQMQSISSLAECISCQSDGLHFSNARNALWKTAAAHQASPPSCIINSIVMMVNITITIIITINNHHQTHLLQMHIGNRDILIASSPPSSSKLMVTFLTILLQSPSMSFKSFPQTKRHWRFDHLIAKNIWFPEGWHNALGFKCLNGNEDGNNKICNGDGCWWYCHRSMKTLAAVAAVAVHQNCRLAKCWQNRRMGGGAPAPNPSCHWSVASLHQPCTFHPSYF